MPAPPDSNRPGQARRRPRGATAPASAPRSSPRPRPADRAGPAPAPPLEEDEDDFIAEASDDGRRPYWQYLSDELAKAPLSAPPPGVCLGGGQANNLCQLCWGSRYNYANESAAKARALQNWVVQGEGLPKPEFIPSKLGRNYRCVSKRRWLARDGKLVMVEESTNGRVRGLAVSACDIEPKGHAKIYKDLQRLMPASRFSDLLNYAILKGDLEKYHLILNMTNIRNQRAEVNKLSKKITQLHPNLLSVWVVEGKADDNYYLNPTPGGWERLYGPKSIKAPNGLHYSPLSFTQINSAMVPTLVDIVGKWLDDPAVPLLDMYCGYGLFSLSLRRTGPIVGLELSRESVDAARENATHRKIRSHFSYCDLDNAELTPFVRRLPEGPIAAVVDPPRGGASAHFVEEMAVIGPQRIVHLVCDVEKTFSQAALWQEQGYKVERMIAIDMFPGTSCLEVALYLSRAKNEARESQGDEE